MTYVVASDAAKFLRRLPDASVDLFLIDPPYFRTVEEPWDNQWGTSEEYAAWLVGLCALAREKVTPSGSLLMFQTIGKHGQHPLFQVVSGVERCWHFRNWITWKKARAFQKETNYPAARDEILWFSASPEEKRVTFNVPFLDEPLKRPTKNARKRVSNVWTDVEQVYRPTRKCQRPLPLLARLIKTHTSPGDLVVDFFAGYGTTGIVAHNLGRRFLGCEAIAADANEADRRVASALAQAPKPTRSSPRSGANTELIGQRRSPSNQLSET